MLAQTYPETRVVRAFYVTTFAPELSGMDYGYMQFLPPLAFSGGSCINSVP